MSPTTQQLLQELDDSVREELIEDLDRLYFLNEQIAALCRLTDDLDTIAYVNTLWDERDALRAKWDDLGLSEDDEE